MFAFARIIYDYWLSLTNPKYTHYGYDGKLYL